MKVKDLITKLLNYDMDREIFVSVNGDEEYEIDIVAEPLQRYANKPVLLEINDVPVVDDL